MDNLLNVFALCLFVTGVFLAFNINPKEFLHELSHLFLREKRQSIKTQVLIAQGKSKKNFFSKQIEETANILRLHKKQEMFPFICGCSFIAGIGGFVFACTIDNYFLAPILLIGLSVAPFIYVKFLGIQLTKQINQELETALSIITSSYVRCEDIISAIDENIAYINPPVKDVFQQFSLEAKLLNPDIKKLIRQMKKKINNDVFQEWCDAMISCQDDAALKSTLHPIVKKLSNIRLVTVELDNMLYAPVKEHVMMCLLVIAIIPIMYFLNADWYDILVHTLPGKIVLAVNAAIIFISSIAVIRISKPITYKR